VERWQKLEIASKVIAAVFVPLAIGWAGNQISLANKQKDSETKFVELATAVLNNAPSASQPEDSKSLRKWAVEVINKYSGVPMSAETKDALVRTTALPLPAPAGTPRATQDEPDSQGTWGVVFGGDRTLAEARHETTVTAPAMGIGEGAVFRRQGSFRSVKVFVNRAEAEDALGKAKAQRSSSYIVNMGKWCPSSTERDGYYECSVP
jgi:hypothetical protein